MNIYALKCIPGIAYLFLHSRKASLQHNWGLYATDMYDTKEAEMAMSFECWDGYVSTHQWTVRR
jgi:hypothetical protein